MEIALAATSVSTLFLAVISLILLIRHRKAISKIAIAEAFEKQRLYEISILRQIQDKIGYSLDVEYIADVIIGSLKHLFPYSTASSMVIKNNKIIFKTHIEQAVGENFVKNVKTNMLTSLSSSLSNAPSQVEEQIIGTYMDRDNKTQVASFFDIPLVIGSQTVGMINVSSTSKSLYDEAQTTVVKEIVSQASSALTKLQNVLVTEKSKLTSMVGSFADGVFMVDTNNNLLIVNKSAQQFLHLTSSSQFTDVISSFGTQYNIVEKIKNAMETKQQIIDNEVTVSNKIFKVFITPVMDLTGSQNNSPIGASILLHDITIEKNISQIKEDFTHMMVHELRAPLTAIKDSSELMLDVFAGHGNMGDEQKAKLLKIIDTQSKNLLEQINQILDAAKIEAGKFTIIKSDTDIKQLIKDEVDEFSPQAQKRSITLSMQTDESLPQVSVDPVRINQVLNNLLSNSLKFTPPGGNIIVSAKIDNDFMVVSVKDSGMGIPEEEQGDLFSKYYQIKTTPHQLAKKGTGLGLFITKGIVEAHGGTVGIDSKENEGTTIFFKIPINITPSQIINEHAQQPITTTASRMVN